MSFVIKGVQQVTNNLGKLNDSLSKTDIPKVIATLADDVVNKAQSVAPVDTGYLRDNIRIVEKDDKHAVIRSEADYSIYVEEGTWKMSAQPFMSPAAKEVEQNLPAELKKVIQIRIREIFR